MKLHPPAGHGHLLALRIYYEDTDAGGVVYHANYLRFAERARTEALRDMGVPHAELVSQHGLMFMVRRVKLDYLGPARLDDSLVVVTRPVEVGAATVDLRQEFLRAGTLLVGAEIRLACVRLADGRAARMPPRWRMALASGLEMAPDGAQ
jgi:acyl-CoA thioester hydrolase